MGKNKDKISSKKQHKYDQIDNNYLETDERIPRSMIMCGIATGMSCMFFAVLPVSILMYVIAMLEKTREYINQSIFILICSGIAIVGSLAVSIVAKVKYRKSRWAVTNIVFISINLIFSALSTWFFIWFMNTYGSL